MFGAMFKGGVPGDAKVALANNYKHIEKIKEIVPPEKLLEFNGQDVWKP